MILFRRLFLSALFIGVAVGLLDSGVQRIQVVPLIQAGEAFESAGAPEPAHGAHAHAGGAHDAPAWEPAEGVERTAWTVVANILNDTGSALLLVAAIALREWRSGFATSWRHGLAWGAAGWVALFALPALGLPPELPGAAAEALPHRQAWWLLAAASAAAGLATLAWGRGAARLAGIALLALPFVVGAPHLAGDPFAGFSPEAAAQMNDLWRRFVVATTVTSAVQWLALGMLSAWTVARWVRPVLPAAAQSAPA